MRVCLIVLVVGLAAKGAALANGFTDAERVAGKKLAAAKCIACHKMYDPTKYEEAKWDEWMIKMKRKAKLNDDQFDKLTRYFAAVRSESSPTTNPAP